MIENTEHNFWSQDQRKYQIPLIGYFNSPRYIYENIGDTNIPGHILTT